ncbi:MAG: hypothetical protein IJP30_05015 [Clostridia bacterium]|nr:hypothetical protein [Clostridia bacterium]MBQ9989080.1 hypothetical protein [Clostridia bacterium]
MIELKSLWAYQEADIKVDRFENELRKSPVRVKLLNVRNQLVEQQNRAKKLEVDLQKAHEECAHIAGEIANIQEQMKKLAVSEESLETQDLKQVRKLLRAMEKSNKTLENIKRDLAAARAIAESTESTVADVRSKLSSGKKQFDELKEVHDAELEASKPEMEKLSAERKTLGEKVPAELMDQYKKIKRQRPNPVAKVRSEQCGGCNMSIPSLMMRRLRAGEQVIVCENCGRILYLTEE